MERSRVAVFLSDAVSGATIAHYGTLLCTRGRRMRLCWVYVPALGRVVRVSETDILLIDRDKLDPMSEVESSWLLANQKWEIQFASAVAPDSSELWGKYRIGTQLEGVFHFLKRNQPYPTYRFTIPAHGYGGRGKLQYFVPAERVLNREVVVLALSELLDVEVPTKVDDGGSPNATN